MSRSAFDANLEPRPAVQLMRVLKILFELRASTGCDGRLKKHRDVVAPTVRDHRSVPRMSVGARYVALTTTCAEMGEQMSARGELMNRKSFREYR